MPDNEGLQNEVFNAAAPDAGVSASAGTLTKQDIQEVVDSAVSSIAGVDARTLSDVCTSLSTASSQNTSESVVAQLDYINSSILVNMVFTGAILGAIVMRYVLDHFGRRVH